jgi:predicted dithiol-disulfide oxidoreductase (DUF899 family)
MDHIRRLRIERAALQLRYGAHSPVGSVALRAGYFAPEVFTRAFQTHFGICPSEFRRSPLSHWIPSDSGIHYNRDGTFTPLQDQSSFEEDLLDDDLLCPAHRLAQALEMRVEQALNWTIELGSTILPERRFKAISREDTLMTTDLHVDDEIEKLTREVAAAKERLTEARRRRQPVEVSDYELKEADGDSVKLSELFGEKQDLIVIHNMGTGCPDCTMWADGFIGLAPHLNDRASFVLVSPDPPEVLKRFSEKRKWTFRVASAKGSDFIGDMGFLGEHESYKGPMPGVSSYRKDQQGRIFQVSRAHFDRFDEFCATWHFLDLLDGGANGWEPKYSY